MREIVVVWDERLFSAAAFATSMSFKPVFVVCVTTQIFSDFFGGGF
jgi:hypothetical protein